MGEFAEQHEYCCAPPSGEVLPKNLSFNLDQIFENALANVFNGKVKSGDLHPETWREQVRTFWQALDEGLPTPFAEMKYTDRHFGMAASMRQNLLVFSAFKNHAQTAELVRALTDGDRLRTWDEFRKIAATINSQYNGAWLQAEYNTAIAAAQMGAQWQDFQEGKEDLPFLKYVTVGDSRVRPSHAALDGIVRHIDDPFWDTWYPPNGWNCRCDVKQLAGGETDLPTIYPDDKESPLPFRFNPGKTGEVFSRQHEYFVGVSDEQASRILRAMSDLDLEDEILVLKNDTDFAKSLKAIEGKGLVEQYQDLLPEEIAAVHHYTTDAGTNLNSDLWSGKPSKFSQAFEKILNSALSKLPERSGRTFRGMTRSYYQIEKWKKALQSGEEIPYAAFTSTSENEMVALTFALKEREDYFPVILNVLGKDGKKIDQMSKFGSNFVAQSDESEVLFRSKIKFKIEEYEFVNDIHYFTIRQVSP